MQCAVRSPRVIRNCSAVLSGLLLAAHGQFLPAARGLCADGAVAPAVVATNLILVTNVVVVTNYVVTTNIVLSANSPPSAATNLPPPAALLPAGGFYPWMTPASLAESNRFDRIQLRSGEWLKGKVKSMQEEKLEFDSEELDVHTFDWEKILIVYSPRTHSVRFDQGKPANGSLLVTRDQVFVLTPNATNSFLRDALIAITPTGARELDKWSADISASMSFRSGNTRAVDYSAHATLQRRTPSTRLTFDYLGNFGEINGEQTEQNHRAYGQFDYFLSRRLFVRLPYAEYYKDPLQNIDHRLTLGTEVGYDWIKNRRVEWNLTAGPAWQRNWFTSVETNGVQNAGSVAMVFGTRLDAELTRRVDLILSYRGQFTSNQTGANTHHAVATLEFEIHKRLN